MNLETSIKSSVVQDLLQVSCQSLGAMSMLVASRRNHEWRMDASFLLSHAVGCQIVSNLDQQYEHSSATNLSLVQIGMNSALCLSANTQSPAHQKESGRHSMLIAVLSRAVEVTPMMVSMLEAFALSMGVLAKHRACHTPSASAHVESCVICDRIKKNDSSWLRWDEYMNRYSQIQLSHTVCPTCVTNHYPDLQEQGLASKF